MQVHWNCLCPFRVDLPLPSLIATLWVTWSITSHSPYPHTVPTVFGRSTLRPHLRNSLLFNSECLFILETQPSSLLRVFSSSETHPVHVASSSSELFPLSFSMSLYPHFLSLYRSAFLFILRTHPSFPLNISSSSEAQPSFLPYVFSSSELTPLSLCMPLYPQNSSLFILHVSSSSYLIPISHSIFLYPHNSSILPSPCPFILRKSAFFPSACLFILRTRPSLPLQVSPSSELVNLSLCISLHLNNLPLSSSTCLFIFSESPLYACHSPTHSCPEWERCVAPFPGLLLVKTALNAQSVIYCGGDQESAAVRLTGVIKQRESPRRFIEVTASN